MGEMVAVKWLLLVVSVACFVLAGFGVPAGRINWAALGMAAFVASFLVG